ncbi:HERP1 protein, partial [Indicator maculatus]|nr:HERP1 protein [Indicator maculatus]
EDDQKLIYAGKLLLDHQHLGELLLKHGELHALHLVYHLRAPARAQGTSAEVPAGSWHCSEPWASVVSVLQQRTLHPVQALLMNIFMFYPRLEAAQDPFQSVVPGFSAYTTYRSMLQVSWLQQLYARQYYLQYLASAMPADPARAQRPQELPVTPGSPSAALPEPFPAPHQAAAAAQGNAAPDQNLRLNAQRGPLLEEEEEEGGGHRDWLDWLYSATLFYVFVNVVYFYSSLSRFLLVMGGTVLMYLHHVGWLPFRRRPIQPFPGNAAAAPPVVVNQDQNNNLQGGNAGGAEEAEASPEEEQGLQELQQASPSFLSTAWVFFKTFFASLLPEGPGVTRN